MSRRKVAIFTGNRAEYGLLMPIIRSIKEHPSLDYYLLVSGAHLSEDFGSTASEIRADGFEVHAEVKLDLLDDTLRGTANAIGTGVLGLSKILAELKPDVFVVYADRFEGFAAMIAGTQMGIPTAHLEGGDLTLGGALDDSVRHAMTKLAHFHLTTNDEASERIRKMGEEPWRVHTIGFSPIDLIREGRFAKPDEVAQKFQVEPDKPVVLFTQHSVTTEADRAIEQIAPSLEAMEKLAKEGAQIVMTYPNNDAGGQRIAGKLEAFANSGLAGVQLHKNLGRHYYNGFLNICGRRGPGACVGNSSSGIKETPAFACPTVNIGSRQEGRLRGQNVIDTAYDASEIAQAVRKCLQDDVFRRLCAEAPNPYGKGDTGPRAAKIIAEIELGPKLLRKQMTY